MYAISKGTSIRPSVDVGPKDSDSPLTLGLIEANAK